MFTDLFNEITTPGALREVREHSGSTPGAPGEVLGSA